MKKIFAFILIAFAIACNNDSTQQADVYDSVETVLHVKSADSLLVSEGRVSAWLNKNLAVENIKWTNLQLENFWNEDSLELQPFTPEPDFYKDYSTVLHYSADSSYILDVGSYGMIPIKDKKGNTTLEAGEPDTEISVIFTKEGKKARLLFAGPSSYIIDGQWLDTSQAMIVGTFDNENNQGKDTLVWIIDVKDQFFRLYNFKAVR